MSRINGRSSVNNSKGYGFIRSSSRTLCALQRHSGDGFKTLEEGRKSSSKCAAPKATG